MICAAPDCGRSFEPRRTDHRFCSATCRLAGFQREREAKRRERDAKVRLLLGEALALLSEREGMNA
jgi:hypothetical protein